MAAPEATRDPHQPQRNKTLTPRPAAGIRFERSHYQLTQCLISPATPRFSNANGCARPAWRSVGVIVVVAVSIALARMEPAAPNVERATVLEDTVKRGSIIRQVRGLGTLVPEDTRWLPSTTDGRVERILLRPGAQVGPNSVILELSNPQVEQEAINARLALQSAEAALENLRVQLQNELLTQQSQTAALDAEFSRRAWRPRPTRRWPKNSWFPRSPGSSRSSRRTR